MKQTTRLLFVGAALAMLTACNPGGANGSRTSSSSGGSAAERVYVAPGEHGEYYGFLSGGFDGQISVYGIPSGRLFRSEERRVGKECRSWWWRCNDKENKEVIQ